jgi:hypothetical protein
MILHSLRIPFPLLQHPPMATSNSFRELRIESSANLFQSQNARFLVDTVTYIHIVFSLDIGFIPVEVQQ